MIALKTDIQTATMRAVTNRKSGGLDTLKLEELPIPQPTANEIRVHVKAATVTRGDVMIRIIPRWVTVPLGVLLGFKPKDICGTEFAGVVDAVGSAVKNWAVGDRVCGTTTGLRYGANAEYVCVPESWRGGVITPIPDGIDDAIAAPAVVGGMTAIYLFEKPNLQPGEHVLVYGASGQVGTAALQIAKARGAVVTAVCSEKNAEMVKSLGADHVVDYTKTDLHDLPTRYDVIFDAVNKLKKAKSLLKPGGRFTTVKYPTSENVDHLNAVLELIRDGKMWVPVEQTITLDGVIVAHGHTESGRKAGNIVVDLTGESATVHG